MNLRRLTTAIFMALSLVGLRAHAETWQPSPGHAQLPIWPGEAPDAQPGAGPEDIEIDKDEFIGGRHVIAVRNVSQPTMTVYSPKEKNSGAAVVVFPGGGYQILAIDLEGTEVCDWLTSRGITCVLLKFRVPSIGPTWDQTCGCDRNTRSSMPIEDAQRTIALVRSRAAEWHIDQHKI